MQPNTQVRLSPQACSEHIPQSDGQLVQSSPGDSQRMLPQTAQMPLQSMRQLAQVSVPRQRPSPQLGHEPQSTSHVKQSSAAAASHMPSPQRGQAPQSGAQVTQSSPALARQNPSPQREHTPQSPGQLEQSSVL